MSGGRALASANGKSLCNIAEFDCSSFYLFNLIGSSNGALSS